MTPEVRAKAFARWDTNNDSILTLDEYKAGLKGQDNLEARFKNFDKNERRKTDPRRVRRAVRKLNANGTTMTFKTRGRHVDAETKFKERSRELASHSSARKPKHQQTMKHTFARLIALAFIAICLSFASPLSAADLVFEGTSGIGQGKHIVFLAGDHEYRSEESLPALARILAKHHGFKCTVLFNIDPNSGEIVAGTPSNMPGMEALETADLAVVFLRFQNLPAEQMKHLDAYLNRGGPVVGMRTATHAFQDSCRPSRSPSTTTAARKLTTNSALDIRCWGKRGSVTTVAITSRARASPSSMP